MGFSETKNSRIKSLVAKKKAKDKALTIAGSHKTAKTTALATKTQICQNDKADLENAEADQRASLLASESAEILLQDVTESCTRSMDLHKEVLKMVEDAHHAARKTAAFALALEEFNTYILKETKHNTVILNLLVKDAAQAVVDSKTAVTNAAKALVDSITAAGSVIHLHNSLTNTKNLIETTLPYFKEKKTGLDDLLDKLYEDAKKLYHQSVEDQKQAEAELRTATKQFNDCTIESSSAGSALDAAIAAVGQTAS